MGGGGGRGVFKALLYYLVRDFCDNPFCNILSQFFFTCVSNFLHILVVTVHYRCLETKLMRIELSNREWTFLRLLAKARLPQFDQSSVLSAFENRASLMISVAISTISNRPCMYLHVITNID